jgi:hypothetical protein
VNGHAGARASFRRVLLGALAVVLACCEAEERQRAIDAGVCLQTNQALTDSDFIEIVLRDWESAAWRGAYEDARAYLMANPACCKVKRYPTERDWRRGAQEGGIGDKIATKLSRLGPSKYVVGVSVEYSSLRKAGWKTYSKYVLSACGDVVHWSATGETPAL